MAQKRIIKLNLIIILIGFILIAGYGIIMLTKIKYGSFISQCFETHMLVMDCNDLKDFTRDYPRSTLNKPAIEKCGALGLI